jgi:hypothetical protein
MEEEGKTADSKTFFAAYLTTLLNLRPERRIATAK